MAWTVEDKIFVWGDYLPMPAWNSNAAVPRPFGAGWPHPFGPNWPVRAPNYPSDDVAEHGPLLVARYLALGWNNTRLTAGLSHLENELRDRLGKLERITNVRLLPPGTQPGYHAYFSALPPSGQNSDPKHILVHHLLRDCMLIPMVQAGFRLAPRTGVRIPLAILPDAEFYTPMWQRIHLKDPLVGLEHGEWTHLLQWYLLTVNPPALPQGVTFDPAEVFEYLGRQATVQSAVEAQGEAALKNGTQVPPDYGPKLWFSVCDRNNPFYNVYRGRGSDIHDCRTPDTLHVGLAGLAPMRSLGLRDHAAGAQLQTPFRDWAQRWEGNRDRWPLLCALLRHRLLKRDHLYRHAERFQSKHVDRVLTQVQAILRQDQLVAATYDLSDRHRIYRFILGRRQPIGGHTILAPDFTQLQFRPGQTTHVGWSTADQIEQVLGELWARNRELLDPNYDKAFNAAKALLYVWSKEPDSWTDRQVSAHDQYQVLSRHRKVGLTQASNRAFL